MWYNLMTDEERENTEFVINLSYGKDSLAAIHVAVDILKIPIWLIRIVHAEVWATDTIPADLPPVVEFKRWADGFIKGCWGLTVEHVCATRGWKDTYSRQFYDCFGSGKNEGCRKGFPFQKGSWCKRLKYGHEIDLREYLLSHPAEGIGGGRTIYGFPMVKGNWCTSDLKTAAVKKLRALQPSGASIAPESSRSRSFPMAPGGEGQREISSIFWALQLMSRSVSLGT